ncbi:MAG: tetratricopeptide repeat protein, partial [Promethearchaeia archaeon]
PDPKFIMEKLIQCYNTYIIKFREKCYNIIESFPDKANYIKKKMILFNIFSLRMNVDIGFKKFMLKKLYNAFQNGQLTKESIKRLLFIILDKLEQSTEQFFNIFDKSTKKIKIDYSPFNDYLKQFLEIVNKFDISDYYYKSNEDQLEFLKKELNYAEFSTSLYRAIEDLIYEYKTGIFTSRYFKKGEIKNFTNYNFNPFLIQLLESQIKEMSFNMKFNHKFNHMFFQLIPEYYLNQVIISKYLYEILIEIFDIPSEFSINNFSILSIHFMSILTGILFDNYDDNEKIRILNDFYLFTVDYEDIEKIVKIINEFLDILYVSKNDYKKDNLLDIPREFRYLWRIGARLHKSKLSNFSLLINKYLYQNLKNPTYKIIALDNVATAYRDLRKFRKAIGIYEKVIDYYKENNSHYELFIAMKNIAYCYYKLGEKEKAENIFKQLEEDFSIFNEQELIKVYYNLAYRYRLTWQFDKEEYYINLALEKMNIDNPFYLELLNRSIIIGEYYNPYNDCLDNEALKSLEIKRIHQENKELSENCLKNFNLELCEIFLEEAYQNIEKDIYYWNIHSICYILKGEWDNLLNSGKKILEQNPNELNGHLYLCIHYIFKKNYSKILFHLLKITSNLNSHDWYINNKISHALSFMCFNFNKKEIKDFIKFAFSQNSKKQAIINLLLIFASIFTNNREKELSGFIYKAYMDIEKTKESIMLYADWCYAFNDFKNAKYFYNKALSINQNDILLLEKLSLTHLKLNEFEESINNIDKILSLIKPELHELFIKRKEFIILIRDSKIRYENIPFKDVRVIFNTIEQQLKDLNPSNEIEFGNVLTELSKALEILLSRTIGRLIYQYIKKKFFPIPPLFRYGNKKKGIKPINRLFLNFLDDPDNNNPSLGNWKYILEDVINNVNSKNEIMQHIYDFLKNHPLLNIDKLKIILEICLLLLDDRNYATHKKLYSKEEVESILTKITPMINEIIPFIIDLKKVFIKIKEK